jgi:hypothetical protein
MDISRRLLRLQQGQSHNIVQARKPEHSETSSNKLACNSYEVSMGSESKKKYPQATDMSKRTYLAP